MSAVGWTWRRDRISVPRDMSLHAARRLHTSLEATAALRPPQPYPLLDLTIKDRTWTHRSV